MKEILTTLLDEIVHDEIENGELVLSTREKYVIEQRFFIPKTLEDVAKEMNLTRERVRQIEAKAIRKIECHIKSKNKTIAELRWANNALQNDIAKKEVPPTQKNIPSMKSSIENLDLTVRSENCLRRNGTNTLLDLVSMTTDDLYKVKNLGRHSHDEIVNKVHSVGLKFKGEL